MTANIRVADGFKEIEIVGRPFQVNDIWLFVHRLRSSYVITEWSTGFTLISVKYKTRIHPETNLIFEKEGIEKIKQQITKVIASHGIANESEPEDAG